MSPTPAEFYAYHGRRRADYDERALLALRGALFLLAMVLL